MGSLTGMVLVVVAAIGVALAFVVVWLIHLNWRVMRVGRSDLGSRAVKVIDKGRLESIVSFQGLGGVPCVLVRARGAGESGELEITFMGEGTHGKASIEAFGVAVLELGATYDGPRYRLRDGEEVADFMVSGTEGSEMTGRVVEAALGCLGVSNGALLISTVHHGARANLPAA